MKMKGEAAEAGSPHRRPNIPWLWISAAILLAALAIFALIRLQVWHLQTENRRLLTLVNPWNPVTETVYTVHPTDLGDGLQADRACADDFRRMLQDCRSAGCKPLVIGAYRSVDDQLVLYDEEVQSRVDAGLSPEDAEAEVSAIIAQPGRSEHELGLAFDIVDADFPLTDERQAETQTARWLAENSWKYGFILRYPEGAEEITGYTRHPWHYRYVGEDAAGNIHALGITLEEYLSLFYSEEAQVVYEQG